MNKKETKKQVKKPTAEKAKKQKDELFLVGVKKEMGKVRWPLKKEMVKYSVATLAFVLFFAAFFTCADLLIAGIKMLVA